MQSHPDLPKGPLTQEHLVQGLRSRLKFNRTFADRIADFLTESFGTIWFFVVNLLVFVFWFFANNGTFGNQPFDPYPYNFLTMVVSLEAIFLAVIVLMSQNRAGHIAEIRQKMDFEINVRAEQEVTRLIKLIEQLHEHMGSKIRHDHELREMERDIDLEALKREAQK